MNFSKNLLFLFISLFVLPIFALASENCSSQGYDILTINGIFTDEPGATLNSEALRNILPRYYHGEPIKIDYLFNPSHAEGVLDVTDAIRQEFLGQTSDYDLVNMLNDASDKITTQKVLLVAHSQGNFYANNFYDRVADQEGGVPASSIGVYGVASPAHRVAGSGLYLTSDTDNVINQVRTFSKQVLPANTSITLDPGDNSIKRGHGFSEVYIPERGARIVADIHTSLDKLISDPERREDVRCLDPQKITWGHIITGAGVGTIDILAVGTVKTVGITYDALAASAQTTYDTGKFIVVGTYKAGRFVVVTTVHTAKVVGSALYSFGQFAWGATVDVTQDLGDLVYNAAHPTKNATDIIVPANAASAILAITNDQNQTDLTSQTPTPQPPKVSPTQPSTPVKPFLVVVNPQNPSDTPRLVYIGNTYPGFGGGMPGSQAEVLSYVSDATPVIPVEKEPIARPIILNTPVVDVPQCATSIALDGCLLATTTVQISWTSVSGALFYDINKDGVYATTTQTTLNVVASDFSDYTFSVSAIGDSGAASATTTRVVSVATIPIAINEIAWMGTASSANDEWLELKNNTAYTIDLSQWALVAKDGTPSIKLSKTIKPYGFLVLERTDDATISDVTADIIYKGALGNTGEQLRLSYASTTLDQTPIGAWVAGDNSDAYSRQSMERISSKISGLNATNWGTWGSTLPFFRNGKDSEEEEIFGTPGSRNSTSYSVLNNGNDITENLTLLRDEGYYLPNDIHVASSSVLTMLEGSDLEFINGDLYIEGTIHVQGSDKAPVYLSGSLDQSRGYFLPTIYVDSTVGTSTFSHTTVDHMQGIIADTGSVSVQDSLFKNNTNGVVLFNGSAGDIGNTIFESTTNEALTAYDGSSLLVSSTTVKDTLSGSAVEVFDGSPLVMSGVTIDNIHSGNGIGVYNSTFSIASSSIENISHGDGMVLDYSTSTISHTEIKNGDTDGIVVLGGTATITDSSISGFSNGAGIYSIGPSSPIQITNTVFENNGTNLISY